MQGYHLVWLKAHPHRTEEWLKDKLKDGFDIHHLDGDHYNNDPNNLVLIECSDHMRMHSGSFNLVRIRGFRRKRIKNRPRLTRNNKMLLSDLLDNGDYDLWEAALSD